MSASQKFQQAVLARLPTIPYADDELTVMNVIDRLQARGFTVPDAVQWCLCLEEVNPDLDEATAMDRMNKISARLK